MKPTRPLALTLFLTLVALSGCLGFLDSDDETDDDTDDGTDDGVDGNSTDDEANRTYHATLEANTTSGDVPLNVTFTSEVSYTETTGSGNDTFSDNFSYEGNLTYRLTFGDGASQEGNQSDYPLEATHEYTVEGNYTAIVNVTFEDGSQAEARINITTTLPEDPQEPPETHFEFGPAAGCLGDNGGGSCRSIDLAQQTGQVQSIDGHFQALDERYWGLEAVAVNSGVGSANADTDCYFLDDGFTIIGEANNGGGPCTGSVPGGSAYIFIFSWGAPTDAMTLDFS